MDIGCSNLVPILRKNLLIANVSIAVCRVKPVTAEVNTNSLKEIFRMRYKRSKNRCP